MIILAIKTDQPTSQFALYENNKRLAELSYLADRSLGQTIHQKIGELLKSQKLSFDDLNAVIAFKGPGSFTGLRIGLSVANALAYSLQIPIIGQEDPNWQELAIKRLLKGEDEKLVYPFYGAEPNITKPKK